MALATRNFRVYTASDVIGAELCGALKNVLAIACGASDGFGFGANARAALITRGGGIGLFLYILVWGKFGWFFESLSVEFFQSDKTVVLVGLLEVTGLAEMTRLVVKKGGKASTITGLAGAAASGRFGYMFWQLLLELM